MDETAFELDSSLKRISMISAASNLWNQPDIKAKIKNTFFGKNKSTKGYEKWHGIMKDVVSQPDSLELPSDIVPEFQNIVLSIGEKIFDWISFVTDILGLDFILTEEIYFMSHGTVDEDKIFDLYWRKIDMTDLTCQHGYFKNSLLFNLSCLFGQEKFIRDHMDEMTENLLPYHLDIVNNSENAENKIYNIMSIVTFQTLNKEVLTDDLKINDFIVPPLFMFKFCLKAGFSKAAKYYWNKLNQSEQISNVISSLEYCLNPCIPASMLHNKDINFIQEKQCETFFFLFNQVNEEQKKDFSVQNIRPIIRMFLFVFPYEEIIVKVLDYDLNNETPHATVLTSILICQNKYTRSQLPVRKNITYERTIKKTWEKIPDSQKFSVVKYLGSYRYFIMLDVSTLYLIFRDENVKPHETQLLMEFIEYSDNLAKKRQYDMINHLLQLISSDGLKNLIIERSILELLGRDSEFKIKAIKWYADMSGEKSSLNFEDDCVYICMQLTRYGNYQFARTFLKWHFETEEKIKEFIEMVKSEDNIPKAVLKIWLEQIGSPEDLSNVVNLSNKFLKFFYESDEEIIELKKNYLDYWVRCLAQKNVFEKNALVKGLAEFFVMSLGEAEKILSKFSENREDLVT